MQVYIETKIKKIKKIKEDVCIPDIDGAARETRMCANPKFAQEDKESGCTKVRLKKHMADDTR